MLKMPQQMSPSQSLNLVQRKLFLEKAISDLVSKAYEFTTEHTEIRYLLGEIPRPETTAGTQVVEGEETSGSALVPDTTNKVMSNTTD